MSVAKVQITGSWSKVKVDSRKLIGESGYFEMIYKEFGQYQMRYSAVSCPEHEQIFRNILRGKKIKHALEIGTCLGTSTPILFYYADRVTTVDINRYYEATRLWANLGILPDIDYYIIGDEADKTKFSYQCNESDKAKLLDKIDDFDFAFIDGNHRDGVYIDYELTKKCGRLLFHDYFHDTDEMPEVMKEGIFSTDSDLRTSPQILELVDSLPEDEVTKLPPFAYWEKK